MSVPCDKNFSHFLSDKQDENFNFTAVDKNDIRKTTEKLDKKSCEIDGRSNIRPKSNVRYEIYNQYFNQTINYYY